MTYFRVQADSAYHEITKRKTLLTKLQDNLIKLTELGRALADGFVTSAEAAGSSCFAFLMKYSIWADGMAKNAAMQQSNITFTAAQNQGVFKNMSAADITNYRNSIFQKNYQNARTEIVRQFVQPWVSRQQEQLTLKKEYAQQDYDLWKEIYDGAKKEIPNEVKESVVHFGLQAA